MRDALRAGRWRMQDVGGRVGDRPMIDALAPAQAGLPKALTRRPRLRVEVSMRLREGGEPARVVRPRSIPGSWKAIAIRVPRLWRLFAYLASRARMAECRATRQMGSPRRVVHSLCRMAY